MRPMSEVNAEGWDAVVDVNIKGMLYGIIKLMLTRPANPCGPLLGVSTQYLTAAASDTCCEPNFVNFDIWPMMGTDHFPATQSYVD